MVEITRCVDNGFPPAVEFRLQDAWGREWLFVEKVVYVTDTSLDEDCSYPQPGAFDCEILNDWIDDSGRKLRTIDTTRYCYIEAVTGETQFDVLTEQMLKR